MKTTLPTLFLLLLALATTAQVNVSLTLRPPYSAAIKDYYHLENKAVIVLTNTSRTAMEVKLGGSISNESRGIYIRTETAYRPAMPIRLAAGATVTLMANADAMNFFDQRNVTTNANDAMLANVIRTGMLPEGTYRICINAYDYVTGRQVSNSDAGCFHFDISQAGPPVITFPQPDHTYPAELAATNFSWTPPMGNLAGALVEYDHIVVRVQPGQNPNDAIAAARDFGAGNPVLNKRGLLTQTYVTQPFDLPFEDGGLYAMQVVARDRNGKLLLENNGRSEVVTFRIGGARQLTTGVSAGLQPDRDIPKFYSSTTLTGTLNYYWPVAAQAGGGLVQAAGFGSMQHSGAKQVRVKLVLAWQVVNEENGAGAGFLLPGGLVPPHFSVTLDQSNPANAQVRTLATATTDANGHFSFNVVGLDAIDFSVSYGRLGVMAGCVAEINHGEGVPVPCFYSGQVRRVLALLVDDIYYANPIQFKTAVPASKDLGTFYSRVKTIDAKVRVQDEHDQSPRSGIEVQLLRKVGHRPSTVPLDELSPGNFATNPVRIIGGQAYEVLAKQNANSSGETTFRNLVFFHYKPYFSGVNPYDRYYVYAEQEESNFSLRPITPQPVPFDFGVPYDPSDASTQSGAVFERLRSKNLYSIAGQTALITPNEFNYVTPQLPLQTTINTEKDKPRLITTVRNQAAGVGNTTLNRAEPGVSYYLYKVSRSGMQQAKHAFNNNWGSVIAQNGEGALDLLKNVIGNELTLEKSGTTGDDGKIDMRNLSNQWDGAQQVGYYRFLKVKKAGFGTKVWRAKPAGGQNSLAGDMQYIAHGETYQMNDLEIQPLGSLFVRLENERGEAITGQAYYHDPVSGQNGTTKGGMMTQENDGSTSYIIPNMQVPTGQIAVVVQPTSTNLYVRDTFIVNVPANQQHTVTLRVKYKLHRIYFNVWSKASGFTKPVKGARVTLVEMTGSSAILYNDLQSPYINQGTNLGAQLTQPDRLAREVTPTDQGSSPPQVQRANNVSMDALNLYEKVTNTGGGVDFAFRNAGTRFKFRITGPQGEISYVTIERPVNSAPGKQWKYEQVELKAGRKVKGTVKLGQVAVAGATVRVLDVEPRIEAITDAEGRYEMNGVPMGVKLRFSASKMGSGYVGMEYDEANPATDTGYGIAEYEPGTQIVQLPGGSDYVQPVSYINFKLRIYNDLDLTKLLGFPLEVTALWERPNARQLGINTGTTVEISGFVQVSDSLNTVFKLNETNTNGEQLNTIRFEQKLVVADDVRNEAQLPYCRPQTLPMRTAVLEQNLAIFGFYNAKMRDPAGIGLNKLGAGPQSQGAAEAQVTVEINSFVDNNIGLPQGQQFYLAHQTGNQTVTQFPVFTSSGVAVVMPQQGIGLSNANGSAISYTLHGLGARATALTSRLYPDSMVLDTRISTDWRYVDNPNLNLAIGRVTLGRDRELAAIDRAVDATTTMGSFSIGWNRIRLNGAQGGAQLDGIIHAAGMNLPFRNAALYPTQFQIPDGSLDADNITLLDRVEVQVNAPASFGYEAARSAWVVAIYEAGRGYQNPSAAVSTAQLEGFPTNRTVPLSSIYLYSNDTRDINLYNSGNYLYRIHDIVDFQIDNILPAQDILKMPGTLNLGIPNFPSYSSAVQYDQLADGVSGLSFQHVDMHPVAVNGVVLGFNPGSNTSPGNLSAITLAPGRLTIKGTVSDENPEVFRGIRTTLTKTNQLTELVIDEPSGARQQLALGGANTGSRMILSEIGGKMWVANGVWNHLYIEGDMPEAMGFTADGKRMRFEVLGALKVEGQQVKLKNMSSPFGNINLVYDMANHRLSGGLQVQVGTKAGPASFSGAINMVIDRHGYYLMSGLNVSLSSPSMQGMAFLLIGDYSERTTEMDALLSSYSIFIQKKLETINPTMASAALNLLRQDPVAGGGLVRSILGNDYLPAAYTGLFNGGAFNGFYFNTGASIPIPLVPSFEFDFSPITMMGFSANMGADVRFGANFDAANTYAVGFSVFLDVYFKQRATWGLVCVYGRIGVMVPLSFNGVFSGNGNWLVNAEGEFILSGLLRVGALACLSAECDDVTCSNQEVSGSMTCGMRGTISNNGANYEIYIGENNMDAPSVHVPPPSGEQ